MLVLIFGGQPSVLGWRRRIMIRRRRPIMIGRHAADHDRLRRAAHAPPWTTAHARWSPNKSNLPSAPPQERRNVQVILLVKNGLGQRAPDRPDSDRPLVLLRRPVAISLVNRDRPIPPALRQRLRRR